MLSLLGSKAIILAYNSWENVSMCKGNLNSKLLAALYKEGIRYILGSAPVCFACMEYRWRFLLWWTVQLFVPITRDMTGLLQSTNYVSAHAFDFLGESQIDSLQRRITYPFLPFLTGSCASEINCLCVHQRPMTSSPQLLVILFYLRQKPKANIRSRLDMQTWPWNASTLA